MTVAAAGGIRHKENCQLSRVFSRLMFIMRARRKLLATAGAACAVEIVLSVPGFAQSNGGYHAMVAADRISAPVLREYVPQTTPTFSSAELPSNLAVPPSFRGLLESMLRRSITFQRQCERIAQTPELVVTLQASLSRVHRVRARTRILRRGDQLFATIEVISLDDPAELIAHEIEHIIEQLDGVDLASKAVLAANGVRAATGESEAFETRRARQVGLAVAAEVRRGGG